MKRAYCSFPSTLDPTYGVDGRVSDMSKFSGNTATNYSHRLESFYVIDLEGEFFVNTIIMYMKPYDNCTHANFEGKTNYAYFFTVQF